MFPAHIFVQNYSILFYCILFYVAVDVVCIQHSFTFLQTELPSIDLATRILTDMLNCSNISDIERCGGPIRQKSKLIKIILMKGILTCESFVTAIKEEFKRTDLLQRMERHNDDVGERGNHFCSSLSS